MTGSDLLDFLCRITVTLTSVHHSIELHRHADTACAVGGEVQGRVLPAFYEEDNRTAALTKPNHLYSTFIEYK